MKYLWLVFIIGCSEPKRAFQDHMMAQIGISEDGKACVTIYLNNKVRFICNQDRYIGKLKEIK